MKHVLVILLGLFVIGCQTGSENHQEDSPKSTADAFVDSLLTEMDLTAKVGQMTQLTLDMLCVGSPYNLDEPHRIDSAKLHLCIDSLQIGSVLNCGGHGYPKEKWFGIISAIQAAALDGDGPGIPVLYGIDAIHGTTYTDGGTLFPQQIGLAATWNPRLAYECGRVTAYETRASGIPWDFSPVLDIGRDARWPRLWETFGEDPVLLTAMGNEMVRGYQGEDVSSPTSVAACLKHFLGYSTPISGKDRTPVWIPDRQLREYYLPGFKAAIDLGAKTIMVNSGEMNGIPVHANPAILTKLLREELKFDGLVVTDWEDIKYLFTRHRVAADYKEAIVMAIEAGIDMSMVPVDYDFPVLLKELVEDGIISEERIDQSVRRILKLKYELGLFDTPVTHYEDYPDFASEAHIQSARTSAEQSMTLLKNDNDALPIPGGKRVFVGGPRANSLNDLNGGWTHTWQGTDPGYNTPGKLTVLEAMKNREDCQVVSAQSPEQLRSASGSDYIVLVLGESPYTEGVGDIEDISMGEDQAAWVVQAAGTGAKVIMVLVEGRPRIISDMEPDCDAILMAYLPGDEGGPAIASTLMGENNPGGKLPYTYPRYPSAHTTYDHKGTDLVDPNFGMNAFNPQYEFGHGLSYTSFGYSNQVVSSGASDLSSELEVSIDVTNIGDRAGDEVVMLFVTDSVASITPPVRKLRKFERISLEAGETKTVSFALAASDFSFVGIDHRWVVEPGVFGIHTDTLSTRFELNATENIYVD